MTTIVFFAVLGGLVLGNLLLWVLFLRLGLRWAKVPNVTAGRVSIAVACMIVGSIALLFIPATLVIAQCIAVIAFPCVVISIVFRARIHRAFQAWLPTLLANVPMYAVVVFVVRPYVYEAFVIPTNAMAPTIVGWHVRGVCPECGEPNYGSVMNGRAIGGMICDNFHVTQGSETNDTIQSRDRIAVAKFLKPRRWDLIVFQYPEDPSTKYVKRLVGLPGETIHIQEGAVWVDGVRQDPPASIRRIKYVSQMPGWPDAAVWGSPTRPARLGDDEYFVLGDFSEASKDSRFWEKGAPGHNPFAVPESYLDGVVTHTYWPRKRWRAHR